MLLKDFYSVEDSVFTDGKFITGIKINKKHAIYKGHFPGRPVTPGVILMQLFKEEAERQQRCKLQLKTGSNVKFMAVVDPNENDNLELQSEIRQENDRILLKGIAYHNNTIALKISSVYIKI